MQAKKPKVSLLLPVYNGEKYLRESIDSVLAQTFQDFELIIYDDGSKDASWEIINSYKDQRIIKYRELKNCGLFQTLNKAIQKAQGELIRLWSHDDRMYTHCLEREQLFFKRHPEVGMFYCRVRRIDAEGNSIDKIVPPDQTPEVVPSALADEISFYWGCMPGNIANVAVPKKVFDQFGLFDSKMRQACDFEMWVRIQEKFPVGFLSEVLMDLRAHRDQLSREAGADLTFLRETKGIFRTLDFRLPPALQLSRRRYHRCKHLVPYFHAAMRSLLSGNLAYSWAIIKELNTADNCFLVGVLWLATGNLHWYQPKVLLKNCHDLSRDLVTTYK